MSDFISQASTLATVCLVAGCASVPRDVDGIEPTALCMDGVRSYSRHQEGTCAYHDGVARWVDAYDHGRSRDPR